MVAGSIAEDNDAMTTAHNKIVLVGPTVLVHHSGIGRAAPVEGCDSEGPYPGYLPAIYPSK